MPNPNTGPFSPIAPLAPDGGGSGAQTLLATLSPSAVASADFTSLIDGSFGAYRVVARDLTFSASTQLNLRVSIAAAFQAGGADYGWHNRRSQVDFATYLATIDSSDSVIQIINATGTSAGEAYGFDLWLYNPAGTGLHKQIWWEGMGEAGATDFRRAGGFGAYKGGTGAIDGLRFLPLSGTFSGELALIGIDTTI